VISYNFHFSEIWDAHSVIECHANSLLQSSSPVGGLVLTTCSKATLDGCIDPYSELKLRALPSTLFIACSRTACSVAGKGRWSYLGRDSYPTMTPESTDLRSRHFTSPHFTSTTCQRQSTSTPKPSAFSNISPLDDVPHPLVNAISAASPNSPPS
jgi:hypothetical protein